ncbi:MAG: hypothetical protein AABW67_00455 [Nanoarchaeota archaeon]
MFIEIILIIIQTIAVITTLFSVILIYKTIKSNENLNQRILFSNITKEEREIRVKLQEYQEKFNNPKTSKKEKEIILFNRESILFNYYEYLAICLYKNLINESETKLYFKEILKGIKRDFENSILFKKKIAKKEEYQGLQWLFKKWLEA